MGSLATSTGFNLQQAITYLNAGQQQSSETWQHNPSTIGYSPCTPKRQLIELLFLHLCLLVVTQYSQQKIPGSVKK